MVMKKILLSLLIVVITSAYNYAQNYNNLLNYNFNGTPTYGIKIKTNLPYSSGTQMPTISIKGYSLGTGDIIDLSLAYYIYAGEFVQQHIVSAGSFSPPVYLSIENSKVVIFIDDRSYYQRFTVSAYAQGMSETSTWFSGWTTADESLSGTHTALLPYGANLAGNLLLSNGTWKEDGRLGIGTSTIPTGYKLAVNGAAIATSMKVKLYANWPDFVFMKDYKLPTLTEVKNYIDKNQHLPDIPSANEVHKNGLDLGEMNRLLLKKVEELTLYLIDKDEQMNKQQQQAEKTNKELLYQQQVNQSQQEQIDIIKKHLNAIPKTTNN
jgi:hypothetical protein